MDNTNNIINRSVIKDTLKSEDLPELHFNIPKDPLALSNSKNEEFAQRLRDKLDLQK